MNIRKGSELGWQVAVDFKADADFEQCWRCPSHGADPFDWRTDEVIALMHLNSTRLASASFRGPR
jgi:hypothetical protein